MSYFNPPEFNMKPFPLNHNHNTINYVPQSNNTYENLFPINTIDNNLFSFNVDNKANIDKKKIKKQEDHHDGSYSINLEDVFINIIFSFIYNL